MPNSARPNPHTRRVARISITGTVLAFAAMWASIAYFLYQSRQTDIATEQRVLQNMVTSVEEQTHHLFSFINYILVTSDLWCQEHPDADPRTDPRFMRLVSEFKQNTSGLIDIRFVSATGQLYYLHSRDIEPMADVSDRDYDRVQMNPDTAGLFIAKPVLSRVTHLWGVPISLQLKARPHGLAVIFASIENRALEAPFESIRTHPDGAILVVSRDGMLLFRAPSSDRIGERFTSSQLVTEQLARNAEGVYQVERSAVDDKARLVAYRTVSDLPLVVIAASSMDDVLQGWRIRAAFIVTSGVLMSLFGGFVLWRLRLSLRTVEAMSEQLTRQADTDFLTQIANRKSFMEHGQQELARAHRYRRPLVVVMFDIDHFKQVNDRYGHKVGDLALQAVTATAQAQLRGHDLLGRLGGEEFGLLLPETTAEAAMEVAERIRRSVEQQRIAASDADHFSVTISLGVAEAWPQESALDRVLVRADTALYKAKESGRNQTCMANPHETRADAVQ